MRMYGRRFLTALSFVAFSLAQTVSASATTIYTSFPSGTYDMNGGWAVAGPVTGPVKSAEKFASSGNFVLAQIDLGLTNLSGNNSALVSLWTEAAGLPDAQLGSWSVSGQPKT